MLYQYVRDIDVTEKFGYIIIVAAVILLATRIGNHGMLSGSGLIGLIVGIIVIYYLNEKRVSQGTTFITSMNEILDAEIMKPNRNKYLHGNSEFVIFLDDHREYYQYNPQLWKDMVHTVNNLQRLVGDIEIGTERFNLDYSTLKEIKREILNQYQAFIHKIPHTESSNNKFHLGMERLEDLLNLEIDHVHQLVVKKNAKSVTTASAFHYKNHPAPRETYRAYTFFDK
jgi:hypothetical protein